jgi:hypothetical protein
MKTYALIILDRSGSMMSCRDATLRGVNEKLQQIREEAKEQEILLSFYTFSGGVYEHAFNQVPGSLSDLTDAEYRPNGSTAMLDAVGYAVSKLREETRGEKDIRYLVEIVSDGEENASHEFSYPSVAKIIQECQAAGNWTFAYMGSNQDLSKVADALNIPRANVAVYASATMDSALHGMRHANRGTSRALRASSASIKQVYNVSASNSVADFVGSDQWTDDLQKNVASYKGGEALKGNLIADLCKYKDRVDD